METIKHDHHVKNIGWGILINIGITLAEYRHSGGKPESL
jgi:hypothetical protein